MKINGFNTKDTFEYENGFYLTMDNERMGKLIAHYVLYNKIINLPGAIVECGVFKGNSFFRWGHFRHLLENEKSRKLIGFDAFGEFPETSFDPDKQKRDSFVNVAGNGISIEDMEKVMSYKKFSHYELIKGDITKTIPEYCDKHPEFKIAFLHIDVDIYEPTVTILENLFDKVVRGGGNCV
ncbi:dTDP-6-deoxy-L-hexose 3-O-methyltransferase [Campylobacter jejuni]|uniref:TylF/MycF/NovP-related O-methyltransferase n=2 Tax=Campylobacteraceae TaxID=72294 RepID=UPI000B0467AF|nr:TylF/MycF/NovP-related O-methyltransferase [Campylobacter jejuni]EIQ6975853.1 dTDP-6-deoxy-L-hexose 3-O-methyltransferase [Campylobacter coli]EAH8281820.1 dTDP-6-deoxy-L-hexose 3-O-methyltransferase [Campylobacter jejuni]EHK0170793.1 dTDP-6-deoxy-L-hexose 3-O-methyltransferase [Campylobacter jejuni]EHL4733648.1 dTDP-6-deoxy-L-hexose 3-O-methyltransferase [Campylobacter jejuni]EHN8504290.1 dTDP-6-deoxy-L-hexose 3-O-methyltransferase [Campylobacter jejuni]